MTRVSDETVLHFQVRYKLSPDGTVDRDSQLITDNQGLGYSTKVFSGRGNWTIAGGHIVIDMPTIGRPPLVLSMVTCDPIARSAGSDALLNKINAVILWRAAAA